MALSHKHIAEAVIVILLIGILLAIFIPKFMDAQVTAKVAQAKRDLNSIYKAVNILQNDMVDERVFKVMLLNDRMDKTKVSVHATLFSLQPSKYETMGLMPDEEFGLLDYLDTVPVQQMPLNMEQDTFEFQIPGILSNTVKTTKTTYHYYGFRYDQIRYERKDNLIARVSQVVGILSNGDYTDFETTPSTWSILSTPGPVLNIPILTIGLPISTRHYYDEYNPTNGILSHGFIVQHTTLENRWVKQEQP